MRLKIQVINSKTLYIMNYLKYIKIPFLLIAILFLGCKEELKMDVVEQHKPLITDFSPKSGGVGTEITLMGENLQAVSNVKIGEGTAEIKYRVNSKKAVIVVSSTSRSGKITVTNAVGEFETTEDFSLTYAIPSIETYPIEGSVNEEIVLEGANLQVIEAVLLDDSIINIISQRHNELVFQVPFIDTEEKLELRLRYFNGEQEAYIGPGEATFAILKEAPEITEVPSSLVKYTPVTITGERLDLIDYMLIGDVKALIISQTYDEIVFDLPTNYFGGDQTVALKAVYYGVKEMTLNAEFQISSDPLEGRYYKWEDITLSGRVGEGGTEDAFFDAETGSIINSCDAYVNRNIIDFMLYDQAGYVQLYGPHNATNVLKNFKCSDENDKLVSITTLNPTGWDDFYATKTHFKMLNRDSVNHAVVIDAYEAGSIVELNDEFFEGISKPGASGPRIYKSKDDSGFSAASGHFSVDQYNIGWVRNSTTGKNGIIKIKAIPGEASPAGRYVFITFDIIWGK